MWKAGSDPRANRRCLVPCNNRLRLAYRILRMSYHSDRCECAYCGGTIYGGLAWVGDDDYCVGCFMERFAQDITELLQIVADICQPLPSVALAIAAE